MKEVLALIEEKQQEFAQIPFIKFLQDQSIDPRERLAFAPCFAPFVMGFGELNKYYWREEPTNDPIQTIINQHTYEDDGHWVWFLEDLQKLGFDLSVNFSDALEFLWSETTKVSRQTIYEIYRFTYQAPPIYKLIVIEAIESTAEIFLGSLSNIAKELKYITKEEYRYFGSHHFAIDSNHSMNLSQTEERIANLSLTDETKQRAYELVEQVFDVFQNFCNHLLQYIHAPLFLKQTIPQKKTKSHKYERDAIKFLNHKEEYKFLPTYQIKRLGSYLIEASLITQDQLEIALNEQKKSTKLLGEVLSSRGFVKQETIEYVMEKVIQPERFQIFNTKLSVVS